jgi:uncharacterized protein YbaR (Trm112 family)
MTKSEQLDPAEFDTELLKILACPRCKGDLAFNQNAKSLDCNACKLRYLVQSGIPVLLVEEAQAF